MLSAYDSILIEHSRVFICIEKKSNNFNLIKFILSKHNSPLLNVNVNDVLYSSQSVNQSIAIHFHCFPFNRISILIEKISEFGACPRKPCNNGYYPIHEAAKNASSKTMEVFFQVCLKFNCSLFLLFFFSFSRLLHLFYWSMWFFPV